VEPAERRGHIEELLRSALEAEHVEVVDESHLHAGHAGAASGAGHFRATIVSGKFDGVRPVQRQRLVFAALGELMQTDIHAMSMETLTPEQWKQR
jgi:BolA protein